MPAQRPLRVKFILPALTEATSPSGARSNIRCSRRSASRRSPPTSRRTIDAVIVDEHVEPLRIDDTPGPRRDPGLHHQRLPRVPHRGPLPRARRVRRARRAARHLAAGRGGAPTRTRSSSAGRADLSAVPRRLPRRPAACASIVDGGTDARSHAADPPRSDRAPPLPRAQLHRRHARLPAALRLLLQGRVLRGGRSFYTQRVDDALAEIARLPGRHLYFLDDHLLGDPRFAARSVRRHEGHEPPVPGRRDGRFDPARRSDRARRRRRAAQPVRRLRDADARQSPAQRQAAESRAATIRR